MFFFFFFFMKNLLANRWGLNPNEFMAADVLFFLPNIMADVLFMK